MCGFILLIFLSLAGVLVFLADPFQSEEEQYAKALIYLNQHMSEELQQANKNDGDDLYQLAYYYLYGKGYTNHPKEAFNLMQKAAHLGHLEACYKLGFMYEAGLGTDVDLEKAQLYYQKADKKDNPNDVEAIQILNYTRADQSISPIPPHFKVTEAIEEYYIELLAQSYENLAYRIEPPGSYYLGLGESLQYCIIYSLLSTKLPKELHSYIGEWKKSAENIVKLLNGDAALDIDKTWNDGLTAIHACNERYPEIAAFLSFEQAKYYINRKFNIEDKMPQMKIESGAIRATCPEIYEFQVDFLRRLARYLREKCKD